MSAPLSCKTSTFTKEEILSSQTMGNSNSSASSRRRLRGGDRSKGLLGNSKKRPPNFSLPFRSVCSNLLGRLVTVAEKQTPPPSSRRESSFRVSRYGNPNTMFLSGVSFQFDVNFKRRCAAVMEAIQSDTQRCSKRPPLPTSRYVVSNLNVSSRCSCSMTSSLPSSYDLWHFRNTSR